jgi:hypothetical protein
MQLSVWTQNIVRLSDSRMKLTTQLSTVSGDNNGDFHVIDRNLQHFLRSSDT